MDYLAEYPAVALQKLLIFKCIPNQFVLLVPFKLVFTSPTSLLVTTAHADLILGRTILTNQLPTTSGGTTWYQNRSIGH